MSECFFRGFSRFACAMLLLAGGSLALDISPDSGSGIRGITVGGYGMWQFGQIVKGLYNTGSTPYDTTAISHQWNTAALAGVRLEAQVGEHVQVVISPEFRLFYPYPERPNAPATVRPNAVAYINEAQGILSFGDTERPALQVAAGMFTFKYNPEARNLGEYIYRTGTYPTYVITDFDFAKARLLGLRVSSEAIPHVRIDGLFTSEYQYCPLYDFSAALFASCDILQAIDIGAGIDFARLLPANTSKTSPKISLYQDPTSSNEYITENGDTAYYSFKATKIMGRLTLDPKRFIPLSLFGPEDLKIYGEIAAIGVEGYKAKPDSMHPAYYNNLAHRMPIMFGFNVPAFKVLDVLSLEWEYFPSYLPNDYRMVISKMSPMPNVLARQYKPEDYTVGAWRWSVYAKKEVLKGFSLTGQVAFDHLRTTFQDGSTDFFECLIVPGNWYWTMKTSYAF